MRIEEPFLLRQRSGAYPSQVSISTSPGRQEVKPGQQMTFFSLFEEATSKNEVIVTFLALLELIRLREFRFEQQELMGDIAIQRCERGGSMPEF